VSPEATLPRRHFLGRALAALTTGAWLGRAARPERAQAATQVEDPYLGEIRMFAGNFAPSGWALCNGQILAIAQYDLLYNLLGTTYGGDGVTTFALPDLRSRVPVHWGQAPGLSNYTLGEVAGNETVTLTVTQLPVHTHAAGASTALGSSADPAGLVPARNAAGVPQYGTTANAALASGALLATGGGQSHTNLQPFLGIHFIICLVGVYPPQP
jgi:microcystin-dependent protein